MTDIGAGEVRLLLTFKSESKANQLREFSLVRARDRKPLTVALADVP